MHKDNNSAPNYLNSPQQPSGAIEYKFSQYISERGDEIIQAVCNVLGTDRIKGAHSPKLALTAPAGGGKSFFILNVLIPYLTQAGYTVAFIAPFVSQVKQSEGATNDFLLVYTSEAKQDKTAESASPAIMCTYDKLPQTVAQLRKAATNARGLILIIDEAQFLTQSQSYRSPTLRAIEKLERQTGTALTIYLTATQSKPLLYLTRAKEIKLIRELQPSYEISKIRCVGGTKHAQIFEQIKANKAAGRKTFAYINSIATGIVLKKMLVAEGVYTDAEIELYSGDKTNVPAKNTKHLQANEQFPDTVQVAIATEILIQAVNIRNDNFRFVFSVENANDKDASRMYQFANRMRNLIDRGEKIQISLFYGEKTSFENLEPKTSKAGKLIDSVFLSNAIRYYAEKNATKPKFEGKKQEAIEKTADTYTDFFLPAPLYRKNYITGGQISNYRVAYTAETEYLAHITLSQFEADFMQFAAGANVEFSEAVPFAMSEEILQLYKCYKAETKSDKELILEQLRGEWEANHSEVLAWYRKYGKDILEAAKIDTTDTDSELGTNENIRAKYIRQFSIIYRQSGKSKEVVLRAIDRELTPAKEKDTVFSNLEKYAIGERFASYVAMQQGQIADISAETKAVIFRDKEKNADMFNLLHLLPKVVSSVLQAGGYAASPEITAIETQISEAKAKKKSDKSKHAGYWEKRIKALRYDLKKAKESGGRYVAIKTSELIKGAYKAESRLYEYPNFNTSYLRFLLLGFTNCKRAGNNISIPINGIEYTLETYASEIGQTSQDVALRTVAAIDKANKEAALKTINTMNQIDSVQADTAILATSEIDSLAQSICEIVTDTTTEAQNKPTNEPTPQSKPTAPQAETNAASPEKTLSIPIPIHAQQLANLPTSPAPF